MEQDPGRKLFTKICEEEIPTHNLIKESTPLHQKQGTK